MNVIARKKQYIGLLKACLSARDDFKDLEYYRDNSTAEEYLILTDIIGQICMLNITGQKEATIYHAVAEIECGKVPRNCITDKAELIRIAKLRR